MSDKNFSKRLSKAMGQSGFTQESLAKGAGVSQSAVSRWLGGSMPSLAVGIRLSTILNVAHEWLIDGLELPPEVEFTDEIRKRLTTARHKEGLDISEVAALTGLPQQTFEAIESGAQIPHRRVLQQLIRVLNVEEQWVLEGRGKMFKKESGFILVDPEVAARRREQAKNARATADFLLHQAERIEWEIVESEKHIKERGEYRPTLLRKQRKRIRWEP